MNRGLPAFAALLLAAGLAAAEGDADVLARFRKAFDPAAPAPLPERGFLAREVATVPGRLAAEASCKALGETLDRIEGYAKERSALREELARLVAEPRKGEVRPPAAETTKRLVAIRTRDDDLRDLDTGEHAVAEALRKSLAAFRDPKALEYLEGAGIRGQSHAGVRAAVAAALGEGGGESSPRALRGALKDRDPAVREAALAALARLRAREEETLKSLSESLGDERWTTRLAAARALAALATPAAVDLLVERLAREDGRLRSDLGLLLRGLTGQNFGAEADGWARWWKDNRGSFESGERTLSRDPPPPAPSGGGRGGESVSYYGITTASKRILYVIDTSGSMAEEGGEAGGSRVESAKKELLRSVRSLDGGSWFTVFSFGEAVVKWRPALVKAAADAKEDARKWIEALEAAAWTNTYGALEEALRASAADPRNSMGADYQIAADTIFLLTDGAPTTPGGKLADADGNPEYMRVLKAVREWNREKRVVLHCVGVGPEINADFLSALARENGGEFVKVK